MHFGDGAIADRCGSREHSNNAAAETVPLSLAHTRRASKGHQRQSTAVRWEHVTLYNITPKWTDILFETIP